MASQALPGLSPWIIPVIAVAAKRTYDRARQTLRGGRPAKRAHDAATAKPERAASPRAPTQERIRDHREATSWPD